MRATDSSPGEYSTRADSVARLTVACSTPGTRAKARSTRLTQEAQVMPPTPRSSVATATGAATGSAWPAWVAEVEVEVVVTDVMVAE